MTLVTDICSDDFSPRPIWKTIDRQQNTMLERIAMPVLSDWIEECISDRSHYQCHASTEKRGYPPILPTRILDLGPFDDERKAQLVVSEGKKAVYFALSHCLENQKVRPLTSTVATLAQRRAWRESRRQSYRKYFKTQSTSQGN